MKGCASPHTFLWQLYSWNHGLLDSHKQHRKLCKFLRIISVSEWTVYTAMVMLTWIEISLLWSVQLTCTINSLSNGAKNMLFFWGVPLQNLTCLDVATETHLAMAMQLPTATFCEWFESGNLRVKLVWLIGALLTTCIQCIAQACRAMVSRC